MRSLNKSQAIRDYLATNPSATPTVIQKDLAKQNIHVGYSLISQVKYRGPTNRIRGAPNGRRSVYHPRAFGNGIAMSDLLAAKAAAVKFGGVTKLREAVEMVEKLTT